jgi:FkbM family methyltransferase
MLIPWAELIETYNIKNIRGILHVGAHLCEELNDYESNVSRNHVLWVEALPDKVEAVKKQYDGLQIECAVVSDVEENITFHEANNGQSSSILPLGTHKYLFPSISYIKNINCQTCTLSSILSKRTDTLWSVPNSPDGFNFINLDIQGAELKALRGMEQWLPGIDYIYTEVNTEHVYQNCALVEDLDAYLSKFGFERVATRLYGHAWGDAFYMRK